MKSFLFFLFLFSFSSYPVFSQSNLLESVKKNPSEAINMCKKFRQFNSKGISASSDKVINYVSKKNKLTPVIMISGHANVQMAVDSLKMGAFEFLQKPFSSERLLNFVSRAVENLDLKKEKQVLESKLFHSYIIFLC